MHSSTALGVRVVAGVRRWTAWGIAAVALLTSGTAAASIGSDCVIQVQAPTTFSATAGSTVSFSLQAVEGTDPFNTCGSANYQVSETSDTTGNAPGSQLQGPPLGGPVSGGPIGVSSPTQSIGVQIANRGGGTVTFNVACTSGCDFTSTPTTVTINVDDVYGATVSAGNGQNAQINTAFQDPLTTQVIRNGANGSNVPVTWDVLSGSATFAGGVTSLADMTDVNGVADVNVIAGGTAGPVSIRMTVDGTSTTTMFGLVVTNLTLEHDTPANGNASGTINTGIPLVARIENDGAPSSNKQIFYTVTSGPSGATVTPSFTTGADGLAPATFTATTEGNYVVQAMYTPPQGAPLTLNFNVQVRINRTLAKPPGGSGDGSSGVEGSTVNLTAIAANDGVGVATQVNWSVQSGPGSFATPSVTSNASGTATNALTLGPGTGTVIARATRNDDMTVFTDYTVESFNYSLQAVPAGGNATGMVGLPTTLTAQLDRVGASTTPLSGETIGWSVISSSTGNVADGAVGSPTTTTAANGQTSVNFTAIVAGTYGVRATYTPAAGAPVTRDYTVVVSPPSSRTLRKPATNSGDGQNAPVDTPLPLPLRVIAEDNGAPPLTPVTINWATSGDVGLSATQTTTDSNGESAITVTSGATPGQSIVTASRADVPSATTSFIVTTLGAVVEIDLLNAGVSNGGTGAPGTQIQLQARATRDRVPQAGVEVIWEVIAGDGRVTPASSVTGDDGIATSTVTLGNTPGDVQVRATRGDAAIENVTYTLRTVAGTAASLTKIDGDNQRGNAGQPFAMPLRVQYSAASGGSNAGVTVQWSVVSGSLVLDANASVTDVNGRAEISGRYGTEAGPAIVRAAVGNLHVDFSLQVESSGNAPRLRIVGGNQQTGLVQTFAPTPLEVELTSATGEPIAGAEVLYTVIEGSARFDSPRASTDAQGRARVALRFGDTAGAVVIRATASGVSVDFNLTAVQPIVRSTTGDNQTGPVGQPLAEDFTITLGAPNAGGALAGIQVNWQVVAGGGTLSTHVTSTDANGTVRTRLTLGPQPGNNRVRATFIGGGEVLFNATGIVSGAQLRIVSGDAQAIPTNDESQPLVVELRTASGQPLPGIAIEWSATNGTLADARTTTDAQGRSQNVVLITLPGASAVTARATGLEGANATFALNGGVANIGGLTPDQERISEAIDTLCPALLALSTRTPEQQDLLQRCLELVDNAGDNPDDVRDAIDQLPSDIGSTLANAGLDTVDAQQNNHQTRFENLRQERNGGAQNQFNIGVWTPDGNLPLGFLPAAAAQDDGGTQEVGADFDRWGFFATGTIGRGESDGGIDAPQFDYDIAGLTAGIDYRFSDRFVAGASLGYNNQDTELANDRGTLDSSGWTLSTYASWFNDRLWYVDGVVSYGSNDYDTERNIRYSIRSATGGTTTIDQRATASTSGDTLGAAVSVGRDFPRGAWNFSTYLRGNYARAEYDRYQERLRDGAGEGLALAIDARTLTSTTAVLGGKATYVLSRDWGVLIPHAQLELAHEFEDDPSRVVARFLYDPTSTEFLQVGEDVDTDYYNVGIGMSALFPGGRSAYVYYEQLLGASRLSQGILSLGVRFEF